MLESLFRVDQLTDAGRVKEGHLAEVDDQLW